MFKNQLIILFSTLDWNFPCDYEKQTARILAQKNKVFVFNYFHTKPLCRVLIDHKKRKDFCQRINSLRKNLSLFPSFSLLPFQRLKIIEKINHKILFTLFKVFIRTYCFLKKKRPILWMFFPHQHIFINKFREKLSLYDCVDYHSSLDPLENKIKQDDEKKMLQKVNIVFANSPALYRLKKPIHSYVHQVPQGFNSDLFLKPVSKSRVKDIKQISGPIIGYIGNIDYRFDFKLIKEVALAHPKWSFVFIGPIYHDPHQDRIVNFDQKLKRISQLKNLHFLGKKTKKQLISYLDCFNVCWIPFKVKLEFVRYCYPMKVFEYFARGKPVISTPIESLIPLGPYVAIAKDAKGFSLKISKILKTGWPKKYKKEQRRLAIANSWQSKVEKISQVLIGKSNSQG